MLKGMKIDLKTLNATTKPMKLLEENIGVNIHDLWFDKVVLDMTPKL